MESFVYLDNNATTCPSDSVVEAMLPLLRDEYANPSSMHQFGQRVRRSVEHAREQVAGLINADPREIVFTSGGTESINLAIRGMVGRNGVPRHVITSAVEHSAVHNLLLQLAREGHRVDEIGVDHDGRLDLAELQDKLTEETALVSLIHANNETGVVSDVRRACAIAERRGVCVHLDAVQAAGKLRIDVQDLPVQLLSMSGHKLHGPKGVGALYLRRRTRLRPLVCGGHQERELRPGTENVPAIIGFGVAAEEAAGLSPRELERLGFLRDEFEMRLRQAFPNVHVIGAGAPRLVNTSNVAFERLEAEAILILLSERGICASAGAACNSGSLGPSRVLEAMGIDRRVAHGAIRFSLSRFTTRGEIDQTVAALREAVGRLSAVLV